MYCSNCGTKLEEGLSVCPNCGAIVSGAAIVFASEAAAPVPEAAAPEAPEAAAPVPEAAAPEAPEAAAPTPEAAAPEAPKAAAPTPEAVSPTTSAAPEKEKKGFRNKGASIAALVLSILSVLSCCVPFLSIPLAIAGIVCGALGLKSEERGMAIAGLIIGILFLIVDLLMIVFGFLAISKGALNGFDSRFLSEFLDEIR